MDKESIDKLEKHYCDSCGRPSNQQFMVENGSILATCIELE